MTVFDKEMLAKDIEVIRKELIHDGFCRIERYDLKQHCFDGSWTEEYSREFIAKPRAVGALPYDPVFDKVVLIEQFRIGALGSSSPWLIELVAGIMDKEHPESDEDLICREIKEETGLGAQALLPVYEYFSTPGCSTEKVKLFCAKVDSTKTPMMLLKRCGKGRSLMRLRLLLCSGLS
jgi:ADP-ribose pyrophosphatase